MARDARNILESRRALIKEDLVDEQISTQPAEAPIRPRSRLLIILRQRSSAMSRARLGISSFLKIEWSSLFTVFNCRPSASAIS